MREIGPQDYSFQRRIKKVEKVTSNFSKKLQVYEGEKTMDYGYIRVSTKEQKIDRQTAALEEIGIAAKNIFCDYQSGKETAENNGSYEKRKRATGYFNAVFNSVYATFLFRRSMPPFNPGH